MRSMHAFMRASRAAGQETDRPHGESPRGIRSSPGRLRSLLVAMSLGACVLGSGAAPPAATAEVTAGPENISGPSGLADGRVYEQVSPSNKYGSEAAPPVGTAAPFIAAGLGGNEVSYNKTGPIGETPTGFDYFSISQRSSAGWSARGALPRGLGSQELFSTNPETGLGFSANMNGTVFGAQGIFVPEQQVAEQKALTVHLYRYTEDGLVQWIGKPTIVDPVTFSSSTYDAGELAGGSPNFDTIYFGFEGTLTPEDDEPNPSFGNKSRAEEVRALKAEASFFSPGDDGFYEWHDGTLESAGVLPDGHLDPYGAVPAATLSASENVSAETLDNQVSEDGRDAFFLSPDPGLETGRPTEIYVRETASDGTRSTALVSRDLMLPEVGGLPAAAPNGAVRGNGGKSEGRRATESESPYIYASPDGSRVFFESTDQLTSSAPNEGQVMEYEFNTQTNTLIYLPGVADLAEGTVHVLRSSRDGSDFIFLREKILKLWNEGAITAIGPISSGNSAIAFSRAVADGSAFLFQTKSPLTVFNFNNGEGSNEQVYRYDVAANTLSCVSCPPVGVAPSGNASLSHDFPSGNLINTFFFTTGNRGISDDGGRVFFDTSSPLLAQDTNGVRDAYEWNDGTLTLVSTGVSKLESFFGDNSPTGNDVFFSTAEGLAHGDADEGYDVYDARIPRPGDQLPPSAVPCEGSVCQGPPNVPQLFAAPASESFEGQGNIVQPDLPAQSVPKSLTRKQKLARALKECRRERKVRKRIACERRVRKRYGKSANVVTKQRSAISQNRGGK